MNRQSKKTLSIILSVIMLIMSSFTAFAASANTDNIKTEEIMYFDDFYLERVVDGSIIYVVSKDFEGNTLATVENKEGIIYANGIAIGAVENFVNIHQDTFTNSNIAVRSIPTNVTWGSWTRSQNVDLKIAGKTTALACAVIAAAAPWISARIIATIVGFAANEASNLYFYSNIRYGYDPDDTMYYQRDTYFYDDNNKLVKKVSDSGKLD